jgi:EAL domain-containing protein (putative c-di-GMP-specific phosphodiesterase class I)
VCNDVGCKLLAEGLETDEEAALCQELGCQLGQGFLFAMPQAATVYR